MANSKLSPQGYIINNDPFSINPFWDSEGNVPPGGTAGQVLTKATDEDYDTTWTTPEGGSVTIDPTPTEGSENAVSSGGVYTALSQKQNTLSFDTTPTYGSTNPVTSSGIRGADVYHLQQAQNYTDEKITAVNADISNLSERITNLEDYIPLTFSKTTQTATEYTFDTSLLPSTPTLQTLLTTKFAAQHPNNYGLYIFIPLNYDTLNENYRGVYYDSYSASFKPFYTTFDGNLYAQLS